MTDSDGFEAMAVVIEEPGSCKYCGASVDSALDSTETPANQHGINSFQAGNG
jgi:hypothetical protein